MLRWLRAHNAMVPADRTVGVVGVDPSDLRQRGPAGRDRAMAETVLGLADRKTVFWGHNGHISSGYVTGRVKAAGAHLRDKLGPAYYALALTFHHGSFQALRLTVRGLRGPDEFTVGVPPRRSIEHILGTIGCGDVLVDLRGAAEDPDLRCWAGRRQRMRSFGSVTLALAGDQFASVVPRRDFDGIAYARCTTRARQLGGA